MFFHPPLHIIIIIKSHYIIRKELMNFQSDACCKHGRLGEQNLQRRQISSVKRLFGFVTFCGTVTRCV